MVNNFERAQIVLLHSNDIHSRLENAARIATIIAEERRVWGADRVLALDIGDHLDRMRMETEGSEGLVNVELLCEAGYEAVTLGNNEGLTYSSDVLTELYRSQTCFAVVCANMKWKETGERPDWMKAHHFIEKNGIRIGIIGATANFHEFYSLLGWSTVDPVPVIQEEVNKIRSECDLVVVMSHLGLPSDRRMAEEVRGIDLILGGHTHHLLEEPIQIGETTICAAGKYGDYVGRIVIVFEPGQKSPSISAECILTGAFPERDEAAAVIHKYKETGKQRLQKVVARLSNPLTFKLERESPLGNLMAAGLRRWTGAEIGLVNTGQMLGGLAAGDVTAGELHALCPSPVNPCLMRISGGQLKIALEQSLLDEYIHKPLRGYGFRGDWLGTLAVDGLTINCRFDHPPMSKIESVLVGGEPLREERIYSVGTIDMFSFRAGYESLADAESFQFFMPEFLRDVVAFELASEQTLQNCLIPRWLTN
ncbi:bifunctional metallophosphatase/5'-nucleotidase [Paenibacillus sp. GCM10027627]|uniref:bifunctional metallophosphatase/5'-nucleotidase n=1 Tax=unclassified Paenibacillus TaxID=185978 RepID=UPI00362EE70D